MARYGTLFRRHAVLGTIGAVVAMAAAVAEDPQAEPLSREPLSRETVAQSPIRLAAQPSRTQPSRTQPSRTQPSRTQPSRTQPSRTQVGGSGKRVATRMPMRNGTTSSKPAAPAATTEPAPKKPVLIPGTGTAAKNAGDDFEDENWKWNYRHPKSSEEQDERVRGPIGTSVNRKWFEGMKRGTPDLVKRIELPSPGIEGSTHGLLLATQHAGIPGKISYQMMQDDFVFDSGRSVGGSGMSVVDNPSIVTRVYLPPFEQWEKRNGPSFGFRAGCYTHAIITGEDHPDKGEFGVEEYWPGMFICFEKGDGGEKPDSAHIRVRGNRSGREIRGPEMKDLGWWTLGMSFTPDGQIHYFASPGVDELTMDDHITSQFPYGYRTERVKTFFYNVCTRDDGKTWSTPWVVDDPQMFFVKRPQVAGSQPAAKR